MIRLPTFLAARLDHQLLASTLYRLWTLLAGGATLVLVPLFLSPRDQGYYFTFLSLLAMQVFFELGLNQVVTQLMARKSAHLSGISWIAIDASADEVGEVLSLARLTARWYAVAGLLFFVFSGLAGLLYFRSLPGIEAKYTYVWSALAAGTGLNLSLSGRFAILDGLGLVTNVARVRLVQGMLGYTLMWAGLLLGLGVFSMVLVPTSAAVYSALATRNYPSIYRSANASRGPGVVWKRDIFPMQWRIAISWISGYFMFQIFTPAIFATQGAAEAGRLGIALNSFSAIQSLGMSWILAKAPAFAKLAATGARADLDQLFDRIMTQAVGLTLALSALAVAAAFLADRMGYAVFTRVAGMVPLLLLSIIAAVNIAVFAKATYLRSHNSEPMMQASVVSALLTAGLTYLLATRGSTAVLLGYLFVSGCITLPWTNILFNRFKARHV